MNAIIVIRYRISITEPKMYIFGILNENKCMLDIKMRLI